MDEQRFVYEQEQLRKLFGYHIGLVRFADFDAWECFGVQFPCGDFLVQAHFAIDHPHSPPRFQLHPSPVSRHYYDDGKGLHLCYVYPNEWRPSYALATAVAIVMVFINQYQQRKVD